METEQTQPTDGERKVALCDISDEELLQIYKNNAKSYEWAAQFIQQFYDIDTSRQAVYKRLKHYLVKKHENEAMLKNKAESILLGILDKSTDVKVQIAAAKAILRR